MNELELDFERFVYEQIETLGGDIFYVRVGCKHVDAVDVESLLTQEVVARWCPDCSTQLPVILG